MRHAHLQGRGGRARGGKGRPAADGLAGAQDDHLTSQPLGEGALAELRIGILGSGYMGRTHAECITKHMTRSRLVAVAGGRRAPALASDYGVEFAPDFAALLARPDIDAVLIATPHADHCPQVVTAARAGKHVLVEKPMATSVADCTTMIEAC